MRISSQLLLTLLLNACWQIPLIVAFASAGSWLLRDSGARYRHWLWVSAFLLSFLIPAVTSSGLLIDSLVSTNAPAGADIGADLRAPFASRSLTPVTSDTVLSTSKAFMVNRNLAAGLLLLYFAFLLYRALKLVQAWKTTRKIRQTAIEIDSNEIVARAIAKCENAIGVEIRSGPVLVLRSQSVPVPITVGFFQPVIILPDQLLEEGSLDLLTSAIGHELIHVARRDYILNLIYEMLYLPLSFNPAAAILRRRIKQTRELCCDELVAERILNPEVYARSLVKLASSAPGMRRLSVTTTVGIADADILEVRIMSLLRKPKLNARGKKMLLIAASLLLVVPCLAAASFAMHFDVATASAGAQDPSQHEKERVDSEKMEMLKRKGVLDRRLRDTEEMNERAATNPQFRAEIMRKREIEMEMREVTRLALSRLARITMEQAIQIATSQQPGKVLECTLFGEGWEEPGKLSKDGKVIYHVVILSGDETTPMTTHVKVNALDGTILTIDNEGPRKRRSSDPR